MKLKKMIKMMAVCSLLTCASFFSSSALASIYHPAIEHKFLSNASRLHSNCLYTILGTSATCDVVQLMDGSKWKVTSNDRDTVLRWQSNHNIVIKPTYSCFWPKSIFSYKYVMYNCALNEVAHVSLNLAPIPNGMYTFLISSIDTNRHTVTLDDGTCWNVDASDKNFFNWRVGQRLTVGLNNHWATSRYAQILINTDLKSYPYTLANFIPIL